MTENKARFYREQLGYTQNLLAEKTQLSIRTIQRIESGEIIPKGHTLTQLARIFEMTPAQLQKELQTKNRAPNLEKTRLRLINLSALSFIGIPFGNILVPIFLWSKYKTSPFIEEKGKRIINFQILWTLILCPLLVVAPHLEDIFTANFSLMLWILLVASIVNVIVIIRTAIAIGKEQDDFLTYTIPFL